MSDQEAEHWTEDHDDLAEYGRLFFAIRSLEINNFANIAELRSFLCSTLRKSTSQLNRLAGYLLDRLLIWFKSRSDAADLAQILDLVDLLVSTQQIQLALDMMFQAKVKIDQKEDFESGIKWSSLLMRVDPEEGKAWEKHYLLRDKEVKDLLHIKINRLPELKEAWRENRSRLPLHSLRQSPILKNRLRSFRARYIQGHIMYSLAILDGQYDQALYHSQRNLSILTNHWPGTAPNLKVIQQMGYQAQLYGLVGMEKEAQQKCLELRNFSCTSIEEEIAAKAECAIAIIPFSVDFGWKLGKEFSHELEASLDPRGNALHQHLIYLFCLSEFLNGRQNTILKYLSDPKGKPWVTKSKNYPFSLILGSLAYIAKQDYHNALALSKKAAQISKSNAFSSTISTFHSWTKSVSRSPWKRSLHEKYKVDFQNLKADPSQNWAFVLFPFDKYMTSVCDETELIEVLSIGKRIRGGQRIAPLQSLG